MAPGHSEPHSVCLHPKLPAWGPIPFVPTQEDSKDLKDSKGEDFKEIKEINSKVEWDQVINPHGEEEASKARVPKEEVQIPSQSQGGSLPPFLRLRSPTAWPWWEKWASKEVLHLLSHGVEPDFACPTLPIIPQGRSFKDQESALQIISDYMQQGACKEVSMEGTSYLVPWFVLKKKEIGGGRK